MYEYISTCAVLIMCIIYVLWRRNQSVQIPSPFGLPLIGGLCEFLRVFGGTANKTLMARYVELGPIYQFGFLKNKMIFLFTLKDLLKLKLSEGVHPAHIDFVHLRTYRQNHGLPLGLLVSTGEDWQRQRKHIGKALLSSSVLKAAEQKIADMKDFSIHNETIKMDTEIGHYVLKAMSRVLMGYEDDHYERETVEDFTSIIETARENFKDAKILLSTPKCLWSFIKAWSRHSGRWDKLLAITERYIEKYSKETSQDYDSEEKCVLAQLLKSEELSPTEAHINITDLILASIDTTSSTILWCVYELSRSIKIQNKLYQEIEQFLENHTEVNFVNHTELPYLRAVIRESQRLHPVGFFMSRMIQMPATIRGYHIEKGTHVAGSMYVMGRDADMFPDPDSFNPDRWLTENPDLENFINNVPFGFGRRMCIGRRVADLVISSYIYNLMKSYVVLPVTDEPIEPTFRLLMVPGKPIRIRIHSR